MHFEDKKLLIDNIPTPPLIDLSSFSSIQTILHQVRWDLLLSHKCFKEGHKINPSPTNTNKFAVNKNLFLSLWPNIICSEINIRTDILSMWLISSWTWWRLHHKHMISIMYYCKFIYVCVFETKPCLQGLNCVQCSYSLRQVIVVVIVLHTCMLFACRELVNDQKTNRLIVAGTVY